jgi:hypothetical protein
VQPHVLVFPLFTALGFFALFRTTFAYSWNRRADRLRALADAESIGSDPSARHP